MGTWLSDYLQKNETKERAIPTSSQVKSGGTWLSSYLSGIKKKEEELDDVNVSTNGIGQEPRRREDSAPTYFVNRDGRLLSEEKNKNASSYTIDVSGNVVSTADLAPVQTVAGGNTVSGILFEGTTANSAPTGYYSKPDQSAMETQLLQYEGKLKNGDAQLNVTAGLLRAQEAKVKEAQEKVARLEEEAERLYSVYQSSPSDSKYAEYQNVYRQYEAAWKSYQDVLAPYEKLRTQYTGFASAYSTLYASYDSMLKQYNDEYSAWRGTIRNAEQISSDRATVKLMIEAAEEEIRNLEFQITLNPGGEEERALRAQIADVEKQIDGWKAKLDLLGEEDGYRQYFSYTDLMQNADFAEKSQYKSTANGKRQSAIYTMLGTIPVETGYDDPWYDAVNRQEDALEALDDAENDFVLNVDRIKQMTDDEIAIYNYLYATEGKERAEEYLSYLSVGTAVYTGLTQRYGEEIAAGIDTDFGRVMYGVVAGLDQFGTGVKQLFYKEALPTTATQYAGAAAREELGNVGKFFYDFTQSAGNMAPSILLSIATQGMAGAILGTGSKALAIAGTAGKIAGSGVMGLSSAGNAYNEKIKAGADVREARMYAFLVGASEGGLSYALSGVSKLGNGGKIFAQKISAIDNAFGRFAAHLGSSMLSEGIEEGLQTVLEPLFATIALDEAYAPAKLGDIAYSFLLGAVSGGFFEVTDAARDTVYESALRSEGVKVRKMDSGTLEKLVAVGLEAGKGTAAYDVALQIQAKLDKGEAVSDFMLGKMYAEAVREIAKEVSGESNGKTNYSVYLSETDIPDYINAGIRQNKNRQARYEAGKQMIVSSDVEFAAFVNDAIGGSRNNMVAYGRVEDTLAKQVLVKSDAKIDVSGYFLELLSDDVHHAYREHAKAKESGDMDMSVDELIYALKNVNGGEVVSARQYKDGGQRVTLAVPSDDGMMLLVEVASKSAGTLRLKTGWKVTKEKFVKKYRGSSSATGSENSTNAVRETTTSNTIIPENPEMSTGETKKDTSLDGGRRGPRVASSGVSSDVSNNSIPPIAPDVKSESSTVSDTGVPTPKFDAQGNLILPTGAELAEMDRKTPVDLSEILLSDEQLEANIQEVAQMAPVYTVDANRMENTGKPFSEIYEEYFSAWGGSIHSDVYGEIAVKKSSVRSEIRHGRTAAKIASIEAIPSVIEHGKIVDWIEKNPGVYRIVVASPIRIGETPYQMGVMLQRDAQNQRLYLHDVQIEEETGVSREMTWSQTGSHGENDSLFTTSILQKIINVKRKLFGKKIERDAGSPRGQNASIPSTTARLTAGALSDDTPLDGGSHGPRVASSGVSSDVSDNSIPPIAPDVKSESSTVSDTVDGVALIDKIGAPIREDVAQAGAIAPVQEDVDNSGTDGYNNTRNENTVGGVAYGGEVDNGRIRGRQQVEDPGEFPAEGKGSGRISASIGAETELGVYSRGSGRAVHTQDSEGRGLTPEQAASLSDTAVVDENGKPLVLYHFTPEMEFDTFEQSDEIGFHFGTRKQADGLRQSKGSTQGRLFRVCLNIRNPLRVRLDLGRWYPSHIGLYLHAEGYLTDAEWETIRGSTDRSYSGAAATLVREALQKNDYDGIVYPNGFEGEGDSYIAFSDEQIIKTDVSSVDQLSDRDIAPIREDVTDETATDVPMIRRNSDVSPIDKIGAPIRENVAQTADDIGPVRDDIEQAGDIAPIREDIAPIPGDEDAPPERDAGKNAREALASTKANDNLLDLIKRVKERDYRDNDRVYLGRVSNSVAEKIHSITGIDVHDFKVAIEARQIKHILEYHGEDGKTNHSMSSDDTIAKMEYVLDSPNDIRPAGKAQGYSYMKNGHNKTADTVLYEKSIGDKSYYVVQAVADTKKKTLYIVTAFIGEGGYKTGTLQIDDALSPDETSKNAATVVPKNSVPQSNEIVKREHLGENTDDIAPILEDIVTPELEDIGPVREDIAPLPTDKNVPPERDAGRIKTVKERLAAKLEAVQAELGQNRLNRDASWRNFDDEIRRLQGEYNGKRDKNTKAANDILRRIEKLKSRRDSVDADYEKRISDLEEREAKLSEEARTGESTSEQAAMRGELHTSIIENIKKRFAENGYDLDKVLEKAKDLSTFATVDNTPQRVMEKSLGYKAGKILSDLTVDKVARDETEGIRWMNTFTDRQSGLLAKLSKEYKIKPGSKKSAAAQMYAEGFFVEANGDIVAYGDAELAKDFPDVKDQEAIKGLARDPRIREIYDETLSAINESRARNAYPEIQRLDNYFLHFRAMDDTFSRLGLPFNPNDIRAKDLPTDLSGVTADLKPGQPYFASARHRQGKRTSFDLLGGLEKYLTAAKNQIYHIDNIQTLRALRNYIAETYGQAKGLENLDMLSDEDAEIRVREVFDAHLSTFAKFLNEEANVLAGKTAMIDRGLEGIIGRRGIAFLNTLNRQVGANMVGYNVSSSLTNFLVVTQAVSKTKKIDFKFNFLKAFAQTVANKVGSIFGRSDGFAEASPVMIRRKGAESFYRTPWQKIGDAGYVLMSVVDNLSTELIARTKYNELRNKGMDSQNAHIETDKWVSRLMGDRSLGQMPQLYNSKMLGIITKFQLEVRNQLDAQFYDTIQEAKASTEEIQNGLKRNAIRAAKVTATFAQLAVLQHLFGTAFEAVAGYNPAFDIIDVLVKTFGLDDDEEDEDTVLDNIEEGFLALLDDLPYTSTFTGGRIPIASALPIEEFVTGKDEYGNEKSRLETLGEALPYYLLPGGYGQLKKSAQGLGMFLGDHPIAGSYTDSGKLRFPVDETPLNIGQAALFGQYASGNARDYFDNERRALTQEQIEEFMSSGLSIQDYWDYREGLGEYDDLAGKADYIGGLDLPADTKNLFINNIADRKDPIDMSRYGDYSGFEEFDFAAKNPEMYDFLTENGVSYAEYAAFDEETKEAWSWAYKNPDGLTLSKAVTDDVVTYRSYVRAINAIPSDKDANGKSITGSRKEKVLDYINGLNAEYGAKIILFKSAYPSDDTYNYEIIDYLNGRADISYSEMETILKSLGFTVDKNGEISW